MLTRREVTAADVGARCFRCTRPFLEVGAPICTVGNRRWHADCERNEPATQQTVVYRGRVLPRAQASSTMGSAPHMLDPNTGRPNAQLRPWRPRGAMATITTATAVPGPPVPAARVAPLLRSWAVHSADDASRGEGGGGDEECPVCFEPLWGRAAAAVVAVPCAGRHAFHAHCLAPWLEKHAACPSCRQILRRS
mmetsp:Transcript_9828/g.32196  ORF Transcript_9828/g.32196 Transcript_9828/m.32196 type:complete len:194 (-) Transcript_9828:246-827(-)